jgi:hypothetical protein
MSINYRQYKITHIYTTHSINFCAIKTIWLPVVMRMFLLVIKLLFQLRWNGNINGT